MPNGHSPMNRLPHSLFADKSAHRFNIERPVQLSPVASPQHRDAHAIARFERFVVIDPHRGELWKTRLRQHIQCQVAKVAVVSLEQGELGHAQVYGVSGGQA